MSDGLSQREEAAPTQGLHVAGIDGEYSQHVQDDSIPRCVVEECQVLFADAPPPFSDTMCRQCERDFEEAEAASRRLAKLRGDTS